MSESKTDAARSGGGMNGAVGNPAIKRSRELRRRTLLCMVITLVVGLGLLASCATLGLYGPCKVPRNLSPESVLGEWSLTYPSDYWVSDPIEGSLVVTGTMPYLIAPGATPMPLEDCWEIVGLDGKLQWQNDAWKSCSTLRGPSYRMEGDETVTLYANGTYQQNFVSSTYSYTSPLNRWEFIANVPDGPKLRMYGMKYFSEGIRQANSFVHITLSPQRADLDRLQKYRQSLPPGETTAIVAGVAYPEDGFIYLYPRNCERRLCLVQMGWRVGSDDWHPNNPVFSRN